VKVCAGLGRQESENLFQALVPSGQAVIQVGQRERERERERERIISRVHKGACRQ
jgi:hypothetical protein